MNRRTSSVSVNDERQAQVVWTAVWAALCLLRLRPSGMRHIVSADRLDERGAYRFRHECFRGVQHCTGHGRQLLGRHLVVRDVGSYVEAVAGRHDRRQHVGRPVHQGLRCLLTDGNSNGIDLRLCVRARGHKRFSSNILNGEVQNGSWLMGKGKRGIVNGEGERLHSGVRGLWPSGLVGRRVSAETRAWPKGCDSRSYRQRSIPTQKEPRGLAGA